MAAIDDTSIARIEENKIVGISKGETNLNLYIDNILLIYTLQVK